jgi:hypothetical protein
MSSNNNSGNGFTELQLQQMIFIYNAVMAGWTAKRLDTGDFKFKKRHNNTPEERQLYTSDGFLERFVTNMQRLHAATSTTTEFVLDADSVPPRFG